MTFGIERQSDQYGAFQADPGLYASRDRVAIYDVPDGVPEYLASARPSITAGLLDVRRVAFGPEGDPRDLYGDGMGEEGPGYYEGDPHGYDHLVPPRRDPESEPNPHAPLPVQPLDQFQEQHHPDDFANYHNPAPPSFNAARHLTADDGPASGDMNALFTPGLYSPEKMMDHKSTLFGGDPERWVTALAVPPAQPAPPAAPVWLGHTYAPGHRVGMPWRDQTLPGTVTHLEGYNVGVRWDDGQHSIEEPHNIQPLHQWK